ncbi:hypothetical protein TWF730_000581 [Orbilia blumenaviensis]|uniref:Uncharacterized protein n=1 Tax=Orbilia blumenaviensis TaxID=1796055 RepID=A0AAV9VMA9_9PEZI
MVGSYDITWNATDVAFWSMFECGLACIIACLPALNHLIIKFIKRVTESMPFRFFRMPKPPTKQLGIVQVPMRQAESYQRSIISNRYGQFVKHWANISRTGSETSGEIPTRWGSRSVSSRSTASSSNPTTNNSSVMETTVYVIDEVPSDIEEEGERLDDIYIVGLGSTNIHQLDTSHNRSDSTGANSNASVDV